MRGRMPRRRPYMGVMAPSPAPPPSARFIKSESVTRGSWNGVYGSQGYIVSEPNNAGTASLPSFLTWAIAGNSNADQTGFYNSVTDEPDLPGSPGSKFLTVWFSTTAFTIGLTCSPIQSYLVSIYMADTDLFARVQTVTIKTTGGTILDGPRTVSSFKVGQWWQWDVTGTVDITFTFVSGGDATSIMQVLAIG